MLNLKEESQYLESEIFPHEQGFKDNQGGTQNPSEILNIMNIVTNLVKSLDS